MNILTNVWHQSAQVNLWRLKHKFYAVECGRKWNSKKRPLPRRAKLLPAFDITCKPDLSIFHFDNNTNLDSEFGALVAQARTHGLPIIFQMHSDPGAKQENIKKSRKKNNNII